ncbi:type VI secretion system baseplate subunit TssG, partial [Sulfurimonas sp. MAG313]
MTTQEINEALEVQIRKVSLPQAIRIVSSYLRDFYPEANASYIYEKIHFKANPSLAFPKSEISKVEFKETRNGIKAFLTLNFMALFGSASPLPSHYSESVLDSLDLDNDAVLVNFLDMFNHHLQKFVYPAWEKQRYYIQYQRDLADKFSKYMMSILGLYAQSQEKTTKLDFLKLMPYIGLLSMRNKSAASMVAIIRHYLSHDNI